MKYQQAPMAGKTERIKRFVTIKHDSGNAWLCLLDALKNVKETPRKNWTTPPARLHKGLSLFI